MNYPSMNWIIAQTILRMVGCVAVALVALWVRAALNVGVLRHLRPRKRLALAIGLSVIEAPSTAQGRAAVGRARIRMSCSLIVFFGLHLTGLWVVQKNNQDTERWLREWTAARSQDFNRRSTRSARPRARPDAAISPTQK